MFPNGKEARRALAQAHSFLSTLREAPTRHLLRVPMSSSSKSPVQAPVAVPAAGAPRSPCASAPIATASVPGGATAKPGFTVAPASPKRAGTRAMSVDGMKKVSMPQAIVM